MFLLCDSLPGIPACKTIPQACPSFSEGLLLLAPLFMPFPPAARLRATPEGVLACWTKKGKIHFSLCRREFHCLLYLSALLLLKQWNLSECFKKRVTAAKHHWRWNELRAGEADTGRRKRGGQGRVEVGGCEKNKYPWGVIGGWGKGIVGKCRGDGQERFGLPFRVLSAL